MNWPNRYSSFLRTVTFSLVMGFCALVSISSAQATNYTGPVLDVRVIGSTTQTGGVRVSIEISGTTACSTSNWYYFDLPSGALESTWTAMLLATLSDGGKVTIIGTGGCDTNGLEQVNYMDALPPA